MNQSEKNQGFTKPSFMAVCDCPQCGWYEFAGDGVAMGRAAEVHRETHRGWVREEVSCVVTIPEEGINWKHGTRGVAQRDRVKAFTVWDAEIGGEIFRREGNYPAKAGQYKAMASVEKGVWVLVSELAAPHVAEFESHPAVDALLAPLWEVQL